MVNGRLRCLGPAQHLKLRFGNGFEENVKLSLSEQTEIDAALQAVNRVLQASATPLLPSALHTSSADQEAPAVVNLDSQVISREQIVTVCEGLDQARRAQLVAPFHSGAMLHEALQSSTADSTVEKEGVPVRMFLEWWLAEQAADALEAFMAREFGARAQLLERSTAHNFRYRVQLGAAPGANQNQEQVQDQDHYQDINIGAPVSAEAGQAQNALSDIFAKFEAHKAALRILEYSVGQTTLEQIFNQFASQQDNPEVLGQAAAGASSSNGSSGGSAITNTSAALVVK